MAVIAFGIGGILGIFVALLGALFGGMGFGSIVATYFSVALTTGTLILAWRFIGPPEPPLQKTHSLPT